MFTEITDYAVYAQLSIGDNSLSTGSAELALGTDPEAVTGGQITWDTDPGDGFDSGWREVVMTVKASGGSGSVFLSIGNGLSTVEYSGPELSDIWGVVWRAGTIGDDRTVGLRDISAQFFSGETDTSPAEIAYAIDSEASTVGTSNPDAETIAINAAEGSGFQMVKVFCEIRLQSPDTPDPTDLFSQLFVFANPA